MESGRRRSSNLASRAGGSARLAGLFVGLLVAIYVGLLVHLVHACAGGSDTSGYLIQARELAEGRTSFPPRAVPGLDPAGLPGYFYIPLGARPSPVRPGEVVPTYPIGLPLLIDVAHVFLSWDHAFDTVILAHSIAGLALTFILGRALGLGLMECLIGLVLLATGPLYLQGSLQGMSEVPALAWNTAAALAAWRARKNPGWAVLAGMALSGSVLIRPNDILMLAPIVVAWWPFGATRPTNGLVRRAVWLVIGALPGCAVWLFYNRLAYGGIFATGYGDVPGLFRANLLSTTLEYYARWLPVVFTPLALFCFGLPWVARRSREAACLAAWAGAYLLFFVCDRYMHETWKLLRYILPAAPALMLGCLVVVRQLMDAPRIQSARWRQLALSAALAVILVGQFLCDRKLDVLYAGRGEETYPLAMAWLNQNIPADSVLLTMQTSGAAKFYTTFPLVRWDELTPESFRRLADVAGLQGRGLYAPLFEFERVQAIGARLPGVWQAIGKVRQITVWRYGNSTAP